MRHLTLMCAGLALHMLMNTDHGHAYAGTTTIDDGADEPTSGGGSAQTEVAQDSSDDGARAEADSAGETDQNETDPDDDDGDGDGDDGDGDDGDE